MIKTIFNWFEKTSHLTDCLSRLREELKLFCLVDGQEFDTELPNAIRA